MTDDTIEKSPNTLDATMEERLKEVASFMAGEFIQLHTQRPSADTNYSKDEIAEVAARTTAYFRERGYYLARRIDELSFDALQMAMDAANIRAAKDAEKYGLPPSGWVA